MLRIISFFLIVFFLTSTVEKKDLHFYTTSIVQAYRNDLNDFSKKLQVLKKKATSSRAEEDLKSDFLAARIAFKRIEFLLVYSNNKEVKKINSPNLQSSEYDSLTPNDMVYPNGLQVIEELIYNPENGSRELLNEEIILLDELISNINKRVHELIVIDDLEFHILVWDAMRIELFRIETLGITGFDVPDSQNSLPETEVALIGMMQTIRLYKKLFKSQNLILQYKEVINLFQFAIRKVKNARDFNSFDRLDFCVSNLHPLSTLINETRQLLQFNYPNNFTAINQSANHLFSDDFFSFDYFSPGSNSDKIKLGEKIFSDPILSNDLSRSCKSCHNPEKGFADGIPKNIGIIDGVPLLRNTPSLWNSVFQTKLFYDSRSKKLEKQALDVIHNEAEMGADLKQVLKWMKKDSSYIADFKSVYKGEITELTLVNALSTYVGSLVSLNSRLDQYMRGNENVLTNDEKQGFNLFTGKAKCATCHFLPLFNGLVPPYFKDTESEILGVPATKENKKIDPDLGKYGFTGLEIHRFSFKTVGIRNVEHTAPYMHNGIYNDLDEVIEFYNKGGGNGFGFNISNQTLSSDSLQLTKVEKNQLILFLKSLSEDE